MSQVGDIERITQNRIVKLFCDRLGYRYLGNWEDRQNNSNIEENILENIFPVKGYSDVLINKALFQLRQTANNDNETLYTNNKECTTYYAMV